MIRKNLHFILFLFVTSLAFGQTTTIIADWDGTDLEMLGSFGNGSFGDSLFAVVENPNPSGINTSANVQNWQKNSDAVTWGGFYYDLPEVIDLTGGFGEVCISVYSDHEFNFRLKIEKSTTAGPSASFDMTYSAPGEWQELCFNLLGKDTEGNKGVAAGHAYERLTMFPEFGAVPDTVANYFLDDIISTTGGPLPPDPIVMADWDGTDLEMIASFGNGSLGDSLFSVVENPNPTGINESANVQNWQKAGDAATWAGFFYDLPEPLELTGLFAELRLSALSDHSFSLRVKLEQSPDEGPDLSFDVAYSASDEWEQVCVNLLGTDTDGNKGAGAGHTYSRLTLFPDFGTVPDSIANYFLDDFLKVTGGSGGEDIISDYEPDGVTVDMAFSFGNGHYGDTTFRVLANPSPDAVNASSTCQEWCKANDAETWAGFALNVDTLDFTGTDATICLSMLSDEAGLLRLKLEGSETGPDVRLELAYDTPGEWQQLCFDFSVEDIDGNLALGHLYHVISFFPDFGTVPAADKCFFFDDIYKITNGGGGTLELLGNFIKASPDHTIMTELINTADLWSEINASGVTVFAPTDAAYNALPAGELDALMNNTDNALYNSMLHHVTYNEFTSDMLTGGLNFIMRNGQDGTVTTANSAVNNANISEADVLGVNGILHVTDAVLEYPEDPEVIVHADYEDPNLSTEWFYFPDVPQSYLKLDNPAPDAVNSSATVVRYTKYPFGQIWQGTYIDLDRPINLFNDRKQLCMDVWFSDPGFVRIKMEKSPTGSGDARWVAENTVSAGWNQLCWDLSTPDVEGGLDANNHIFNRWVLFFDFENGTPLPADTVFYYIDNLIQKSTSTATNDIDELENFSFYPNPTSGSLFMESDTPIHSARIYDITGKQWMTIVNPVSREIDVAQLHGGIYFVTLQGESGELLGTVKFVKI